MGSYELGFLRAISARLDLPRRALFRRADLIGDPGGGAHLAVQFFVFGQNDIAVALGKIRVDHREILRREGITAADADHVVADGRQPLRGAVAAGQGHVRDDMPVRKLDDAVTESLRKVAVMRNDQHQLLFREFLQRLEHLFAGGGVQCPCRFIRHDDLRVLDECAGDRNSLFLPAGKFVRLTVSVAREIHLLEERVNGGAVRALALQLECERDIRPHRKLIEDIVLLKHEPDERVAVRIKIGTAEIL